MNNNEIVQKLWNMANILRDDGISYQDYVTELTYILFLKMMKEQGEDEKIIPEEYRWDRLVEKEGLELMTFYKQLLLNLGDPALTKNDKLNAIYKNASTSIDEPKNLDKIIKSIDELDWYSAKTEGLGDLYEGLLEKNANESKSGAGQYFTPRPLIDVMVELIDPEIGELINDPAAGTFGFGVASDRHMKEKHDQYFDLTPEQLDFQKHQAISGMELVPNTHKLALMNALLHDIDGKLVQGDSLSANGKWMKNLDVVLTNPPFGTKRGGERATRDDLTYPTSNKQLNFLQTIYNSLKANGKARAAVVVPDNVLFEANVGEDIRRDLFNKCNVHTILRLPKGIFYAQGVATNVLFFTRGTTDTLNTQETYIYDMRTDMRKFGKTTPLLRSDFDEFVDLYNKEYMAKRSPTYDKDTNPNGRWRKFDITEFAERPNFNIDISWIEAADDKPDYSIEEIIEIITEKRDTLQAATTDLIDLLGDLL